MQRNTKTVGHCPAAIAAQAIFKHYDSDKNGVLDKSEVLRFMEQIYGATCRGQMEKLCAKMFKMADENGDSRLTMRQLTNLFQSIFDFKSRKKE